MRTALVVGFVALFFASTSAWANETPSVTDLDSEQVAELLDGDVVRSVVRGSPIRGEVVGLVEAPMDELISIVTDWDTAAEWAPSMRHCRVAGRDGDYYIIEGETSLPFPISNRHWQMRSQYSNRSVDGHDAFVYTFEYIQGSGNIDESFGYWLLMPWQDNPEYTYVKYVVNADPGIAVPRFIINWATRSALPDLIQSLGERHREIF